MCEIETSVPNFYDEQTVPYTVNTILAALGYQDTAPRALTLH